MRAEPPTDPTGSAESTRCLAWPAPPEEPTIEADCVHVWRAELDFDAPHAELLRDVLDDEERLRAARFVFERDRKRFIASHAAQRTILARYLRVEPGGVRFATNRWGKSYLAGDDRTGCLTFNMSHSEGLALVAVALGREVGVDIERIRGELADEQVAERFFSRSEAAEIRALGEAERAEAFFNCWTRKEAYIKATGKGLSIPLDKFQVSLAPGRPASLVTTEFDAAEASRWSLVNLAAGGGCAAALAAEGHGWKLACWQWPRQWAVGPFAD